MKLIYHLSQSARKKIFIETGRDPGQVQSLEVDPATLTPDERRLLVERDPNMGGQVSLSYPDYPGGAVAWDIQAYLTLEAIATDASTLLAAYCNASAAGLARADAATEQKIAGEIERFRAWNGEREPGILNTGMYKRSPRRAEWIAAHAEAARRAKARQAEIAEERRREQAEKEAEKHRRLTERAAWAAAHGSARLRKCVEASYDCQRLYVTERAAVEFPGYQVDFDDEAAWRERSGPSEAALDEAARVGGEVVWLTKFGEWEDWDESPGREAVVVRGYLGRYDLIKAMA